MCCIYFRDLLDIQCSFISACNGLSMFTFAAIVCPETIHETQGTICSKIVLLNSVRIEQDFDIILLKLV